MTESQVCLLPHSSSLTSQPTTSNTLLHKLWTAIFTYIKLTFLRVTFADVRWREISNPIALHCICQQITFMYIHITLYCTTVSILVAVVYWCLRVRLFTDFSSAASNLVVCCSLTFHWLLAGPLLRSFRCSTNQFMHHLMPTHGSPFLHTITLCTLYALTRSV
jgi:hypothetical protein